MEGNRQEIDRLSRKRDDLINLTRLAREDQANILVEQKRIPTQYQALIQRFNAMSGELATVMEKLIEIQRTLSSSELQPEGQENPPATEQEAIAEEAEQSEEEQGGEQPKAILPPDVSPQEIYNMARSDYLKGNFQLAIEGFSAYRDNFSESPLADNALYWIGESNYSQGKYEDAITSFNDLILNYPNGDKLAAAYLKKGYSLAELGKTEEALSVLRLLISKFPLEEEAKLAEQKIRELSGGRL
jgi:tol-pal system protein YbgF